MLGRVDRRDLVALATLGLAGIGIPLWLSAAAGAIGIPCNDDWVYMRAAGSLFRTGSIDMPGHTAAFIGQLVMVQPLLWLSGGSPWAFTAFGLGMTFIGVTSTYLLARRFFGTGSAILVVHIVDSHGTCDPDRSKPRGAPPPLSGRLRRGARRLRAGGSPLRPVPLPYGPCGCDSPLAGAHPASPCGAEPRVRPRRLHVARGLCVRRRRELIRLRCCAVSRREAAVAMGYDARTVDAGLEWVGYHASGVGNSGSGTYGVTRYYDRLSSFRPCAVLSNSPLDDGAFRLIRVNRSAYLRFLFFGPAEPLYLYGALADGCPTPPAASAAAMAP